MSQVQKYERGSYNELLLSKINSSTVKQVKNLFEEVKNSAKVDEHGNWEFGSDFDRKGRGYAINYDFYAIGRDYFTKRLMIIVQVRKYEKVKAGYFPSIQKSYFLCGRNEDNTAFAHPVESRVIHHAINNGKDVIRACQSWMFGIDYTKVVRQGDMCMIPVKKLPIGTVKLEMNRVLIQGSHELMSKELRSNGTSLYALNPEMYHLNGVHPALYEEGWMKIITSKRASYHDFAAPTID